jgi:hypothetical protein
VGLAVILDITLSLSDNRAAFSSLAMPTEKVPGHCEKSSLSEEVVTKQMPLGIKPGYG